MDYKLDELEEATSKELGLA